MTQRASGAKAGDKPFPIVGIGASAGGLEAVTGLLERLPVDIGMALVFVQHLDPAHESELARLLARRTSMPAVEATDKLRVLPNHVYVIPPNVVMTISGGVLMLAPRPEGRRSSHVIDSFFESLALDQAERAIGVVLSGTASDGTLGLEAIKAEGGITFAQDATAKYDSMPRNAIATGCVDLVLPPSGIAAELARLARHPFIRDAVEFPVPSTTAQGHEASPEDDRQRATAHQYDDTALPSGGSGTPSDGAEVVRAEARRGAPRAEDDGFKAILMLLHRHSGVDFSLYKSTTIQRRIARRMVLTQHLGFAQYAQYLHSQPYELDTLYSDVLISVTSFFRNPEAFEALKRLVFPQLLKRHHEGVIRIWVLGCSTGQEAYSLGIALIEYLDGMVLAPKLQIFATDLNESLLDKARAGLYAKSLAADLSEERLRRFFVEEPAGYRVAKSLREAVIFARQNLITDPPFSRIDLISCRNLLIYLDQSVQKKIIPVFHYALKPGGVLFLGASESVGNVPELFEVTDNKHKIFTKKPGASSLPNMAGIRPQPADRSRSELFAPAFTPQGMRMEMTAQREADRILVHAFAPPGVLVDEQFQILQFRGATSAFLRPPSGRATFDILKMAREGLLLPLQSALAKAKRENVPVKAERVRVDGADGTTLADLHVLPLKNLKERHFLVLFEPPSGPAAAIGRDGARSGSVAAPVAPPAADGDGDDTADLPARERLYEAEHELAQLREYVVTVQEQSDSAQEELQTSNEEAQSANEELQSINEELQTSKEELESTNEELTTVNEEMGTRNDELRRVNADLNNLHVSIHTAILVLGRDLSVRRFTPLAEKAFNLMPADVGRPISGIRHNLYSPGVASGGAAKKEPLDLEEISRSVVDTLRVREQEVQDRQGTWYSLRVRPFMTLDNKIDGAVLALLDIDALKRSEQQTAATLRYAQATFNAMRDAHLVLTGDLRVKMANDAFYRRFQVSAPDIEGRPLYELDEGQWNIPALRPLLESVLSENSHFDDFEVTHEFKKAGRRVMLLCGRRWTMEPGAETMILLSIVDVTERRREMQERHESEARFRLLAETMPQRMFTANTSGEVDYCNPQWIEYAGLDMDSLRDWGWTQLIHPEDLTRSLKEWRESIKTGKPFSFEHRLRRADGEFRWHVSRAVALPDAGGQVRTWICTSTDIHDVKESDQRKDEFLATLAHELRNPLAPIGNALQILHRTTSPGDASKSAIDMLQRQFAHAVRLMDDLLDISRISRGKITLHRVRMDLALALGQAVEAVRMNTDRMKQQLTVESPPEPIYLDADPSRLIQIVGNLLSNASKFSDRQGHITVKVAREDGHAVIRIKDDGIGLAANQLRRIFDMFVQVDTTLERSQGGLGIGLTLVKKLVEMHDGTIEAVSAGIGTGSEFIVRLPAAPAAPAALRIGDPELQADGAKRRILVVDDNVDSAESLSLLLQIAGHEVYKAHDGLAAVQSAAELEPDVILLDIGLPRLNGYEAGRRIRQQRDGKPLLLVALTGWGQETDRQRSREAGFDFHLVKPVDPAALNSILERRT